VCRRYVQAVEEAIQFDADLYQGTAGYYDRFRNSYPPGMVEDLLKAVEPSGTGRLLDLACGTGQIAFAMAGRFGEVWAVDQEPDMIDVVRSKAARLQIPRMRTIVSSAEDLVAPADCFELVAIGNAFHRLDRDSTAANVHRWLRPGGFCALLWSTSPWTGAEPWQKAMAMVLEAWKLRTGGHARIPAGWDSARRQRPDATVLADAGFQPLTSRRFPTAREWTPEELIGLVYSTSFLPRAVLGDRVGEFERDLRRELDGFGSLRETIDFAYELAGKRA
jgi:SAM-dependent methyltransferase